LWHWNPFGKQQQLKERQTMKSGFVFKSIAILVALNLPGNTAFAQDNRCSLEFSSVPSAAKPGQKVTVSVRTLPGVQCRIEAQEESLTQALALKAVNADKSGKAAWTFEVNKNYKADKLPIIVTAATKTGQEEKVVTAIPVESTAAQESLELKVASQPTSAAPGQEVTVTVMADPGTKLKIEAQDAGVTQAMALTDKTADHTGKASWTFKISEGYKADKMPIIVTGKCGKGEKKFISVIPINRAM
jgi:hypothetical protein